MQSEITRAMKLLFTFSILILLSITVEADSLHPINSYCPVTPEEHIDSSIVTEYNGVTVAFCCERCLRKFVQDPGAYSDKLPHKSLSQTTDNQHNTPELHNHEHDHAIDHGDSSSSFYSRLITLVGKFHVLLIHFPIAFLTISSVFQIFADLKKSEILLKITHVLFSIGAIFAIFAALTGWILASSGNYPDSMQQTLLVHRWGGTFLTIISVIGLFCVSQYRKPHLRILLRVCIVVPIVLAPLVAHFGGSLVYGANYLRF